MGGGGGTTVKFTVPEVPVVVVTLTVRAVCAAVPEIAKVAVIVVGLTTVTPLTVIPVPETFTVGVPAKLVPVRVTGTLAPCAP